MRYSRNKIDKAGAIVASPTPIDLIRYAEAITIINDWREQHLPVLIELAKEVSATLAANNIKVSFSSQRLKRMVSIVEKIKRFPNMDLGGMQDIGGARFGFEDMPTLLQAKECLLSNTPKGFSLDHEVYDYVSAHKESGYRSIHFVFRYHSDKDELDGMRVELQIRTMLQHDWATAVETAELVSKSPLKAGTGDKEWLAYFKLVSAIFARQERMPVPTAYSEYDEEMLCREYAKMNASHNFTTQLQTLVNVVALTETQSFDSGLVVVHIDYPHRKSHIRHFPLAEQTFATNLYAQIESKITPETGAVVLVSVSNIQELREAYPSYFLNAEEFIAALNTFSTRCQMYNISEL